MGEVYRARDSRLGREVAVKVLSSEFSSDPDRRRRFEQEAQSASALNHPNIITIHEIGSSGSMVYIAMELVSGGLCATFSTVERCRQRGSSTTFQIADAVAKAHAAGSSP